MSTDIIARLQLRADQFSSENARAFAELKQRATTTAKDVRSNFTSALTDVQRLARTALDVTPSKGGGLNLQSEIAQLREAAMAADRNAAAFKMLEEASHRVAFAEGVATEKELQRADAAKISARMEEESAAEIRRKIATLEQLQVELDQVAVATGRGALVTHKATEATAQQRQSMMMLGQQAQDFTVQVVSGQSVMTAFAQQIGQAAFAVQGMGGRLEKVAAFLGSGMGIAATIGLVAITPLVAKLFEGGDALKEKIDKLKEDAEQSEITRRAEEAFTKTLEAQLIAARKLNDELDRSIRTDQQVEKAALGKATRQVYSLREGRPDLAKRLANAQAEARLAKSAAEAAAAAATDDAPVAQYRSTQANAKVLGLTRQLKELDEQIVRSERAVREARLPIIERQIAASLDAGKAATDAYTAALGRLREERARGAITERQFYEQDRRNQQIRDAAIKAERDRQSAEKRKPPALGTQLSNEQGAATLAAAQRYAGTRESGAGKGTLRDLFSTAGISIDPEKTAWCAAFVNAVLAGQGIKGTGSLAARSFLNYGTATSRPTQGDIVVLKRGTGDQGHVGFYDGTDARGRVRVTGGNQGRDGAVTTTTFARSDVLGFRRAPTASKAYADELRAQKEAATEAKRANAELETSLDQLSGKFDPVRAAARTYREELEQIEKLVAAGRLTPGEGFDLTMRSRQKASDASSQSFNDSFRQVFGEDAISGAVDQLTSGIMSGADLWANRLELGAVNAGEALAGAVGNVAEMFGLRISGPLNGVLRPGGISGQSRETAQLIGETLKSTGINLSTASMDKLSGALAGAAMGQIGGSIFSSITGGKQSKASQAGSALGGIGGEMAGKALAGTITKAVGGKLGSLLGGAAGPIGAMVGGVLGGVLGGLFTKAPRGSAVITSANGAAALSGSKEVTTALSGSAKSVQTALRRVADTFGAEIGAFTVSIGKYKDYYRVSSTGSTQVGAKKVRGASLVYDGTDEQAAITAAVQDAFRDGAIRGLTQAGQRRLQLGGDLDAAIAAVQLIEAVPRDLKAMLDPVGAAIDDLNRKFKKTVTALQEGGASAEEMAQAEQLYNLQLQQVKSSTAAASSSLKSFLTDLKMGSASPYSLRDREATALEQLKPFLDQIGAGQRVDQEKYQSAARAYLDIERELYGSTSKYFDAQALIQAATAKAIETIDNAVPIAGGTESPFAKATAASAAKTAENTQTGNELLSQLSDQMGSVRDLLERISGGGAGGNGFIGSGRGFVNAA